MDQKEIYILGVNHRVAGVEVRGRMAFTPSDIPRALEVLLKNEVVTEAIILSTCNRTEIYVVGDDNAKMQSILQNFLCQIKQIIINSDILYFYKGKAAAQHLFQVASGLDSMILGETQILKQIKDALHTSQQHKAAKTVLAKLFQYAIITAKRAHSETEISAGAVSVAYATVELAQKIFKSFDDKSALLIGAGETGELTARHLKEKGIGKIYITNRTYEKAQKVAEKLDGEAIPFESMTNTLPKVDIAIGATGAPHCILSLKDLPKLVKPLFLLDIAIPRDFATDLKRNDYVFLHDLDNLQQIVEQNLSARRLEIPKVQIIISEEMESFYRWLQSLKIAPTIVALRKKFEGIREEELQRYLSKISDEEKSILEGFSKSLINKLLHSPCESMKDKGQCTSALALKVQVLQDLFSLKDNYAQSHAHRDKGQSACPLANFMGKRKLKSAISQDRISRLGN